MKKALLIACIFLYVKTQAQDMIYLADGSKVPGKISEITKDSVKFKNLANPSGPFYSYAVANLRVAFNAVGNYLVFSPVVPFTDKDRDEFINGVAKPRPLDIAVDLTGKLSALAITSETETELSGSDNGKDVKLPKGSLDFLIRKNGSHQLFYTVDQALPYLAKDKSIIDSLLSHAPAPVAAAPSPTTDAKAPAADEYIAPDMALFGIKAIEKTREFTTYLQAITAVKTNRDDAVKSITLASNLFLNQGLNSRVEVSSIKTPEKKKYLVSDYLNRLMVKSGLFDKVNIDYADINYASKFTKGPDGNFYGTVSFVQKFEGFVDGNLVYGDQTKRYMVIVLKHYEKEINGQKTSGWDVYLDDIGIVETKKL
jgi:hypothetical protein